MRHLVVVALLALAGCSAQGLPIDNAPGNSGTGGTGTGGDGGARSHDMAMLGGDGAACKTACDCTPGLACVMGVCQSISLGKVFCCASNNCPSGQLCQSPGGSFAQCKGGGGPGGSDLGEPLACNRIPCGSTGDFCKALGCGACTAGGVCGL